MGGGRPIIIVKKKKIVKGGHHGGSWKVAYADFVTAMMAFFLVMWIVGLDDGVKDMVEGYFSNPIGFKKSFSGGANPLSAGNAPQNLDLARASVMSLELQEAKFKEAAEGIEDKLRQSGVAQEVDAEIEIIVAEEGLRIELMETGGDDTFFERSSATLKPALSRVLAILAPELEKLPHDVIVEGHTDALSFRGRPGYGNWELSVDRANAARRVLQGTGLARYKVAEVRGYAARQLKVPESPFDAHNRRITVLLPYGEVATPESLTLSDSTGTTIGAAGEPPQ